MVPLPTTFLPAISRIMAPPPPPPNHPPPPARPALRQQSAEVRDLLESRNTREPVILERFSTFYNTVFYGDLPSFEWLRAAIRGHHSSVVSFLMQKQMFTPQQKYDALDLCVKFNDWDMVKLWRDAGTPWVSPDNAHDVIHTAVHYRLVVSSLFSKGYMRKKLLIDF